MNERGIERATLWAPDRPGTGGKAQRIEAPPPGQGSTLIYDLYKGLCQGVPTSGVGSSSAQVSLTSDTIKVMLTRSTYTAAATDDFVGDIVAHEITGGGASGFAGADRKTLGSKTLVVGAGLATFDAADPTAWTIATGETIGGCVIYKHITNDAASPLICYLALTNTPSNGGSVTLAFNASGILTLS
jgi:hypothetical protein